MFDRISEIGIIPILAVGNLDAGLRACEALRAGGLPVVEVTFRNAVAADVIRGAIRRFPDLWVGAGTLLTPDDVRRAADAGAMFAVSPGCTPRIMQTAATRGLPLAPGVATPSDVERALEFGLRVVKFFPAEALGGVRMLRALNGPYAHVGVRFIPTGGIRLGNLAEYLALENVAAVGGTWLAPKALIRAGDWGAITRNAREALAQVAAVRAGRSAAGE